MASILSRPQCVKAGTMVATTDDLVPIWHQVICNHHVDPSAKPDHTRSATMQLFEPHYINIK